MARTPIKLYNYTANETADMDSETGLALYRGDSFEDLVQAVDENGDPFDLGPTLTPTWTLTGQVRQAKVQDGGTVYSDMSFDIEDGPEGWFTMKIDRDDTALISGSVVYFDVQATNVGDIDFAVGFRKTLIGGSMRLRGHYTA